MGQQGDNGWAPGSPGQPQGWEPEPEPPTVLGPAHPVPGPGGDQPAAPPLQASPWPSYQPPAPGDAQFGGQQQFGAPPQSGQQWGQQPGGAPQWGQPEWGQGQPQSGQPSQPGGFGGPFPSYGGQSQRPGLGMAFQRYRRTRRRRPLLRTSIIVLIVFIVGGVIAAVNQGSDNNDNDNGDTSSNAPLATYNAKVGAGITLAGLDTGEQMNVTVSQLFSKAEPADPVIQPPAGMRLYAVQFVLKDTGSAAYSDAPGNSATIFDSAGRSFKTKFDEASSCKSLPAVTSIAAGASASGCVVFDVPKASKITKVRFILDSGDGPQTGIWKIS